MLKMRFYWLQLLCAVETIGMATGQACPEDWVAGCHTTYCSEGWDGLNATVSTAICMLCTALEPDNLNIALVAVLLLQCWLTAEC